MKKHRKRNHNIECKLAIVFAILAVVLFFVLSERKNSNQQQHLDLITERYQFAYNTIYDQYKQLATNFHSGMTVRFDIEGLYQQLLTADEEERNRLRERLLRDIRPRFEELQKSAKMKQLHFHLRNNESFARLHRSDKFGDDLSEIRETVSFVNTEHIPIDGFEVGRICGGYRFIFPITAEDRTHLGSMEISFGAEALTSTMME